MDSNDKNNDSNESPEKKSTHQEENLDFDLADTTALVRTDKNRGETNTYISLAEVMAASKHIIKMKEPKELAPPILDKLKIIYPDMKDKSIANVYRDLRTKLLHISKGRNFILLVTSVSEAGGATHIAMNLASSFSFDSTKTSLLVDCNLSKPKLHELMNVNIDLGLTDYVENDTVSLADIIYPTGVHRLRLIPVGRRRESAAEYFTSIRMRILIEAIKKRYPDRFIFMDSPSIGAYSDAKILADLCDYVLLVVPHGRVTESKLREVISAIDTRKIAGIILN
jgi:exopolysaccharide/PEP-CTERM locus tyrosine autokinase